MAQDARRSIFSFGRRGTAATEDQSAAGRAPLFVGLPTLWKAMILTSFVINLVLIAVVLFLGVFVYSWRATIDQVVLGNVAGGNIAELRDVVQQLQLAHIKTVIPLQQDLPLKGAGVVVPVDQQTTVTLVEPVPLSLADAEIDLGAGNRLRAQNINLVLPAGTPLNILLKMNIPLDAVTIPIKLNVPVDIAMKDTELAPQFSRLGALVDRLVGPLAPYLHLNMKPAEDAPKPAAKP